ncbi:cyclic nucleotide-binding domain-containing protein 1 isoform X2 [Leucoraja erinacea]|uniref:cyclic nucleotide-binding domain-containing protein 1 isoform X2 n=1 Tax=Leucoraja erinaceus TaxID=7782 RepID=UPI002455EA75|nr:cyclic nucleotide-binding domain-containing protein 1 isoform X2 [Leucoraja erinacea]
MAALVPKDPAAVCRIRSAPTAGTNYFLGIDYENVQKLCNISGLQSRDNPQSTPDAHCEFLQQYRKIFIQPKPVLPKIPVFASVMIKRPKKKVSDKDVERHLEKRYMDDVPRHLKEDVKTLNGILSKHPYYRTRSERLITYKILGLFPAINKRFADEELKDLSAKIIMESWEKSCIVFGYQSFYLILRGCAKPYSLLGEPLRPIHPPPWLDPTLSMLAFGDSFGSLLPMSDNAGHKVLSVLTESNCQLVKISTGQFENEIIVRNYTMKEKLIQACRSYQHWPKLSLSKLVQLINWKKYPKDYVLAKEGEISSIVGFIKSGQCYIFKDIEGLEKLPLGRVQSEVKHIIMGKLSSNQSFGEISILLRKPFTCTLITATEVELGVISERDILGLEEVYRMLLQQTSEPILVNLTQEEVNNRYISLEKEKQWKRFKNKVIKETILYRGIKPGVGKWNFKCSIKDNSKKIPPPSF